MPTEALTTKAIEFGAIHAYQFDEASGDLLDFVGSNDGTISGTPDRELSDGYGNGASAYGFDGSTDYIALGSNILNGASAYTIEFVFVHTAASFDILLYEIDAGGDGVGVYVGSGGNLVLLHNAGSVQSASSAIDENRTYHVVASWDGATIRLYIDGVEVDSDSVATPISTSALAHIGRSSISAASYWQGNIAHLAIYDSALSQAQINELVLTARPPVLRYQLDLSASAADSALTDYATRVGTASISTAQNTAIMSTDTGNGADVWFSSDEAGTLPIDAKLVYWDDASSKFAFDVEITSISAVTGATIYLQVGSKPGGYGTDPYKAAATARLPMATDFDDLTSNGYDGTGSGGITAGGVTGPDGSTPATSGDGADVIDIAEGGTLLMPTAEDATVSGWFYDAATESNIEVLTETGGSTQGVAVEIHDGTLYAIHTVNGTAVVASSSYTAGQWNHFAVVYEHETEIGLYLNGVLVDTTADTTSKTSFGSDPTGVFSDNGNVRHYDGTTTSNLFFEGYIANLGYNDESFSPAEINADYLLQGPTASSYWTVTDVTPGLPEATFDLRSDREVVLSGSDVTSWGNASGGTSPTYSDDPADKVLGFPAIQFDSASSEYLVWDETASVFSGDEPDFTAALLIRAGADQNQTLFSAYDSGSTSYRKLFTGGANNPQFGMETGSGFVNSGGAGTFEPDDPYLVILKSEQGVLTLSQFSIEGSLRGSVSADFSSQASITTDGLHIGATEAGGLPYSGDIFRIRLYDYALAGDLTGDLTGTQLGALKDEMLRPAGGGNIISRFNLAWLRGRRNPALLR